MADITTIREDGDGWATVLVLRLPEHIWSMHDGSVTRVEVVSSQHIAPEDRV